MPVIASRYRGGHVGYSVSASGHYSDYAVSGSIPQPVLTPAPQHVRDEFKQGMEQIIAEEQAKAKPKFDPIKAVQSAEFDDFLAASKRAGF
jgi:hypothetical protein